MPEQAGIEADNKVGEQNQNSGMVATGKRLQERGKRM